MLVILLTVYNHFIEPTITKLISLVLVQTKMNIQIFTCLSSEIILIASHTCI